MRGDCALAGEFVATRFEVVGGVTGRPTDEPDVLDSPSPSSKEEPRPAAEEGLLIMVS